MWDHRFDGDDESFEDEGAQFFGGCLVALVCYGVLWALMIGLFKALGF